MITDHLVPNWKQVIKRAWTVWLAFLSALFAVIEVVHADLLSLLPALTPYLEEGTAAKASALIAVIIPLARIWRQTKLTVEQEMRQQQEQ